MKSERFSSATIVTAVLILLVVYVLSPGPVGYFFFHTGAKPLPPAVALTFDILYAPLRFLADHNEFVSQCYVYYLAWWGTY